MLSKEQNDLLTRVGAGTPMGNLFRRFWFPALLRSELQGPDSGPVRLRLLGEDLLAFRDSSGRVGIIDAYCSHRLAPLFFGRNEDGGLRCVYHGWKFDVGGRCLDLPNVPDPKNMERMKSQVGVTAYPTQEAGGLIWVYMGPEDRKPPFPHFEWTRIPDSHVHASRWLQRTNWVQGMEGEIDTSHLSFLHKYNIPPFAGSEGTQEDAAPDITLRETEYGFTYGARRVFEGQYYWRQTQWMLPMYAAIAQTATGPISGSGRIWVPVDDHHTTTFCYRYWPDRPLTDEEIKQIESGLRFPPRIERGIAELLDGYRIDTFLPTANRQNDYLMDRASQKTYNFSGIYGFNEQDRAIQEGMRSAGPERRGIADRSREHLVTSDLAVVTARRLLLQLVEDLQAGKEPALASKPEAYAVRAVCKITPIADFDEFRAHFAEDARAKAPEAQKSQPESQPS